MARTNRNKRFSELKRQSHIECSRPDNMIQGEIEEGYEEWLEMQDTEMSSEAQRWTWQTGLTTTQDGNET